MKKISNNNLSLNYIKKFSLRNYFNDDLIQCCEIHIFDKNELICTLNESMDYMYFLVQGKAKVYTLLSTGKSLLICFNRPLSIMGDLEFMDNPLADCNVLSLEECTLLAFPFNKIREFAYNDPIFLRFIISSLHIKLRSNSSYSSINLLYPLENRFASYLISSLPSNSQSLTLEIDGLNHISELLGSSYRHLNRVIKSLCDKKIISKDKNFITILNYEELSNLAKDLFK
ncbi:Crp/Fnr family transcriptional regulator [Clostridium sp.]|uniref:Crp/Fnr family transcriptional regulator n=1 Tax=Clostridium sp. TaxID=1506 RepID=UPI003F2DC1B7